MTNPDGHKIPPLTWGQLLTDYEYVRRKLDDVLPTLGEGHEIVSGTARGVDRMGERYAKERVIPCTRFPAQWGAHGKSAGFIRNTVMADYADALVAFWDGESRGTKHMIDTAMSKKLTVVIIQETGETK